MVGVMGVGGPQSHHSHCHPHPAQPDPLPSRRTDRARTTGCRQTDAANPQPGSLWVGVTPGVSLSKCPSPGVGVPVLVQFSGCPQHSLTVPAQLSLRSLPRCLGVSLHGPCPGRGVCPQEFLPGCPAVGVPVCPQPGLGVSGCPCPSLLQGYVPVRGLPQLSPQLSPGQQTGRGRAPSPPRRGLQGAQPSSA